MSAGEGSGGASGRSGAGGAGGAGGANGASGPRRSYVKNEAEREEDRADWKWLNARERGEQPSLALDPRRIETYRRIEEAIGELPELFAPEGWSDAVLAEADRLDSARSRSLAPVGLVFGTIDPFDASEVSTESDRVRLAATRTKSWLASGTDSGLAVVGDEPPIGAEDAPDDRDPSWPHPTLAAPRAVESRHAHRWLAVAGALALAAVVLLWLVLRGQPAYELKAQTREAEPQAQAPTQIASATVGDPQVAIVRGDSRAGAATVASVGDTYTATLEVPVEGGGELRLYRDDREVVARCPGTPGCTSSERAALVRLSLRLPLLAPGSYRLVYFEGPELGEPSGDFDRDLARCNCKVKMQPPVSVN
jgi:hypothetical protein